MAKKKATTSKGGATVKISRGRKGKYHEFLVTFKELMGLKTANEVALVLGKQVSNMSAYLSGAKEVRKGMLSSGLSYMSQDHDEWKVIEDQVMLPVTKCKEISEDPGVYFIYDSAGHCLYLGKAKNLKIEVKARLKSKSLRYGQRLDSTLKPKQHPVGALASYVTTVIIESDLVRHNMEALFLRTMINGTHNANLGKYN